MAKDDRTAATIRACRIAKGWSQLNLSAELGVSKDAVSRWERGKLGVSPVMLGKLKELFGEDFKIPESRVLTANQANVIQLMVGEFGYEEAMARLSRAAPDDRAMLLTQMSARMRVLNELGEGVVGVVERTLGKATRRENTSRDGLLAAISEFLEALANLVNERWRHEIRLQASVENIAGMMRGQSVEQVATLAESFQNLGRSLRETGDKMREAETVRTKRQSGDAGANIAADAVEKAEAQARESEKKRTPRKKGRKKAK